MPESDCLIDPQVTLAELRAAVARLDRSSASVEAESVSLCRSIDAALPAGGLVLARAAGPVVWIGSEPDIWPEGLQDFGLLPADLILVAAKRGRDGLWAFEEALRSPGHCHGNRVWPPHRRRARLAG